MARSRKKTLEQRVVGVATLGMPASVQKVARTKWGARIFLLTGAALFSAGILNVQWTDGRPQLKVDRERAKEVKENIVSEIESAEGVHHDHEGVAKFRWFEPAEEQTAEPGLIRGVFEQGRDLSAKVLPKPTETPPPANSTKLPWLR